MLNIIQDNQKPTKPTPNKSVAPKPQQNANDKREILGNVLPIGGAILGGVFGAGVGALVPGTNLTGASEVAGGAVGAAAGGAIGEAAQQRIENLMGTRKSPDFGQIGTTGLFSGVADLGGELIAPVAKLGVKAISFLGNVPEELLMNSIKNPQAYVPGFKGGQEFLTQVVKNVGDSLGKYSDNLSTRFGAMLKPIANNTIKGGGEAVTGLVDRVTSLLTERNIVPSGMGTTTKQFIGDLPLNFEGKTPSAIIQGGERKAIQTAYNLINGLREEIPTASKLNAVYTTLGQLRDFTQAGGDMSKEIIGRMYHEVGTFIENQMSELAKLREVIKPSEQLLSNIREIIPQKAGKNMTAQEIDAAKEALLSLVSRTGSEAKKAVEEYGKQIGSNIMQDVGGAKLAGVKLEGMAKLPPGSASQLISKFVRLIPQEIAKLPVRFAGATELIGKLVNNGLSEDAVKAVLQALYTGKKQGK
jgi:hypothetical protein